MSEMKGARFNQEECFRLAERVAEIVLAIINQMSGRKETITSELNNGIDRLAQYVLLEF